MRTEGYVVGKDHVRTLLRKMGLRRYSRSPTCRGRIRRTGYIRISCVIWKLSVPIRSGARILHIFVLAWGFAYLVAIVDWYSRYVLSWRLSNTLEADFCVDALQEAISKYGIPEVFNTDQGTQFTSQEFIGVLPSIT